MATLRTVPELVILPGRPGEYVAANPFTRSYVLSDLAGIELLSYLGVERTLEDLATQFPDAAIRVLDASRSRVADGLLGDPTGLDRSASLDGVAPLDLDAVLGLLRSALLVVEDEQLYAASLGPRRNLLDRGRTGNIHQQVADHVLLELRERDLDNWWLDQKFSPDRGQPRPGLYRDVQLAFMRAYYDSARLEGARVLDFGCGPGLFSRLFASRGATVVAADVNDQHLATTRALAEQDGLADRIATASVGQPLEEWLTGLDGSFDLVFLSDVLMFYFHPYAPSPLPSAAELLSLLADMLADDGTIAVLEPYGDFWQRPWLGPPDRPFTILTEHAAARERVTPTLAELAHAAERAGLVISRVRELGAEMQPGERASNFAAEFPLWWFFELRRLRG